MTTTTVTSTSPPEATAADPLHTVTSTNLVNRTMRARERKNGVGFETPGITRTEMRGTAEEGTETVMDGPEIIIVGGIVIMIEIERGVVDVDHALHQMKRSGRGPNPDLLLLLKEGQVVLTWHHLFLEYCLVMQSQFVFMFIVGVGRQCWDTCPTATHGSETSVDFIFNKEPIARISRILCTFSRQTLGAPQTMPGMLQNMLPFGMGQVNQLGALSMMPFQAMTQQATRHARRVYVGGLPPLANEQTIATFFSGIMAAIGGNSAGTGDAVVNVYINHEKKFAFVEMRTVEEASNAMALDGIVFEGVSVRVRRPTDYNPSLAAALGPSQPNPQLNLSVVGLSAGTIGGIEGPDRIFVGGLPYYFTETQIRELLESFGALRGFDLVKDRDTGNSKGYGFCVYQDPAATDIACAALNGLKMGEKTLTVRRATISSEMVNPEHDNVLVQAQQHIAFQKLAMQAGGLNFHGVGIGPVATEETPTKVLCLSEVITAAELIDDGEYEEILEDMKEEGAKFGILVKVIIPRPDSSGEHVSGVGKVFLEYSDVTGCAKAKDSLSGRKFGGNPVTAVYYAEEKFSSGDYSA